MSVHKKLKTSYTKQVLTRSTEKHEVNLHPTSARQTSAGSANNITEH